MEKNLFRVIYQKKHSQLEYVYDENNIIIFTQTKKQMSSFNNTTNLVTETPIYLYNGFGKITSPNDLRHIPYAPKFSEVKGLTCNFQFSNIETESVKDCIMGQFTVFNQGKPYFLCIYHLGKPYLQFKNGKQIGKNPIRMSIQAERSVMKTEGQDVNSIKKNITHTKIYEKSILEEDKCNDLEILENLPQIKELCDIPNNSSPFLNNKVKEQ